jgi:hypothetical protein
MGATLLKIEMELECDCGNTFMLEEWPTMPFNHPNMMCGACYDAWCEEQVALGNIPSVKQGSIGNHELNFG